MVTVDLEKCPRCDKAVYEAESAFAGTHRVPRFLPMKIDQEEGLLAFDLITRLFH